jgi:hypothetical protein
VYQGAWTPHGVGLPVRALHWPPASTNTVPAGKVTLREWQLTAAAKASGWADELATSLFHLAVTLKFDVEWSRPRRAFRLALPHGTPWPLAVAPLAGCDPLELSSTSPHRRRRWQQVRSRVEDGAEDDPAGKPDEREPFRATENRFVAPQRGRRVRAGSRTGCDRAGPGDGRARYVARAGFRRSGPGRARPPGRPRPRAPRRA